MQSLPCLDIKLKRVVFHEAFYKFVYLLGHFGQIWQRKSKVKIWKTSEGGRKKRNLIIIESTKPVVTWESTWYILKERKSGFVEVCCEMMNSGVYLHTKM